jgi:hypothetical protein
VGAQVYKEKFRPDWLPPFFFIGSQYERNTVYSRTLAYFGTVLHLNHFNILMIQKRKKKKQHVVAFRLHSKMLRRIDALIRIFTLIISTSESAGSRTGTGTGARFLTIYLVSL